MAAPLFFSEQVFFFYTWCSRRINFSFYYLEKHVQWKGLSTAGFLTTLVSFCGLKKRSPCLCHSNSFCHSAHARQSLYYCVSNVTYCILPQCYLQTWLENWTNFAKLLISRDPEIVIHDQYTEISQHPLYCSAVSSSRWRSGTEHLQHLILERKNVGPFVASD